MSDFLSRILANHFAFKLMLTPFIIGISTLASRQWGETVGGLLIGLPLTSGPVSIFFATEQGPQFAQKAALTAMLGLIPVSVFCTSYSLAARRLRWGWAALVGVAAYASAVVAASFLAGTLLEVLLLVPLALAGSLWLLGKPEKEIRVIATPWWDIPLRILIATTMLVLITTAASYLGPKWSGLLSPFPVFTFVMAFFTHSQGGFPAVGRFIRGVLRGLFSFVAFFIVASQLMLSLDLFWVYTLSTLAALAVNGLSIWRQLRPRS